MKLPNGFIWDNCDLTNPETLAEVHKFLDKNYVESKGGDFRLNYSEQLIKWALTPPGNDKDYWIGVRIESSKKLVGFISGVNYEIKTGGTDTKKMIEINFLCVDKVMRSKSFAPLLIAEVARRANTKGIFQAFYTSGNVLPTPYAQAR